MTAYQNHKTFAEWLGPHDAETRNLVDSMGLWVAPQRSRLMLDIVVMRMYR